MAKIEMDLSEYDTLIQNKKLLEQALDRERELTTKINTTNKEKIEALEAAQLKVICINKTQTTNIQHIRRGSKEIIDGLYNLVKKTNNNSYTQRDSLYDEYTNSSFIDTIFELKTTTTDNGQTITYHGLDDIRKQIYNEIKNGYDLEVKEVMEQYPILKLSINTYKENNIDLGKKIEELNNLLIEGTEKQTTLAHKIGNLELTIRLYKEQINTIKEKIINYNWFNSYNIITKIRKFINE